MAFKLTYSDGQESDYDDDTVWEVDDGVLKMGRSEGNWTVLLSPSHWAVIEVGGAGAPKGGDDESDTESEPAADDSDDDSDDDDDDADKKDDDEKDGDKKDGDKKDD